MLLSNRQCEPASEATLVFMYKMLLDLTPLNQHFRKSQRHRIKIGKERLNPVLIKIIHKKLIYIYIYLYWLRVLYKRGVQDQVRRWVCVYVLLSITLETT